MAEKPASESDLERYVLDNFSSREFAELLRRISEHEAGGPPPDLDRLAGFQLGAYRLVEPIGFGRTAVVYRAIRPTGGHTDDVVAVKLFRAHVPVPLRQETANHARLKHENILAFHDFGEAEGVTYMVTQYAPAGSLRAQLEAQHGQPFDWRVAADLLGQFAGGLEHAAAREMVHRDVKPENLLLDRLDRPGEAGRPSGYRGLLGDLGLARLASQLAVEPHRPTGTPLYYSPEMTRATGHVGPRSDLFALGVVAYEMLTGRYPFPTGGSREELYKRIREYPVPSVRESNPDVPPALTEIVSRMLEKSELNRLSADDAVQRLRTVLADESRPTPPIAIGNPAVPPIHIHVAAPLPTRPELSNVSPRRNPLWNLLLRPEDDRSRAVVVAESPELAEHRRSLHELLAQYQFEVVALDPATLASAPTFLHAISHAHLLVVVQGIRYEPVPDSVPEHPPGCSYAEWAYRHAHETGQATMALIAHADHPWTRADFQSEQALALRRDDFERLAAKGPPPSVAFKSLDDLRHKAVQAFALVHVERQVPTGRDFTDASLARPPAPVCRLPVPPALYPVPPYPGRTEFVGRADQLAELDRWLASRDPVLVVKALGGSGKSMLAWEWCQRNEVQLRSRFRGIVRYEFAQETADFSDLLRHVLGYLDRVNPEAISVDREKPIARCGELVTRLNGNGGPYLLIVDGVEWLLHDPADAVGATTHPRSGFCKAPAVGEFFKQLRQLSGSKVLLTSRHLPKELQDIASRQPLTGCQVRELPDLSPADVRDFATKAGIRFTPESLGAFAESFGRHALTLGLVCGLVADYPICPRDFDAWRRDPNFGGSFRLNEHSIEQAQEHVLARALKSLGAFEQSVLGHLAACVTPPTFPALVAMIGDRRQDSQTATAPIEVTATGFEQRLHAAVTTLRDRELVRVDVGHRYGMHDLVRRHLLDGLAPTQRRELNERLLGYVERLPAVERARTLDDVVPEMDRIVLLLRLGRYREAYICFASSTRSKLNGIAAYSVIIRLSTLMLEAIPTEGLDNERVRYRLWGEDLSVANLLTNNFDVCEAAARTIQGGLRIKDFDLLGNGLFNLSESFRLTNRVAAWKSCIALFADLALVAQDSIKLMLSIWDHLDLAILEDRLEDAERIALELQDLLSAKWPKSLPAFYYRLVRMRLNAGTPIDDVWDAGMADTDRHGNDLNRARLQAMRSESLLERGAVADALAAIDAAITIMDRLGIVHTEELDLQAHVLARLGRGEEVHACLERGVGRYHAARAYQALGDIDRARACALAYHRWAWADGPNDCDVVALRNARELLRDFDLPDPDPADLPPPPPAPPFESEIRRALEQPEGWTYGASNIYLIRGKDSTGRAAWYYLQVEPGKKSNFEFDAKRGQILLTNYGRIIISGYGEYPPSDVKEMMAWEYNFSE